MEAIDEIILKKKRKKRKGFRDRDADSTTEAANVDVLEKKCVLKNYANFTGKHLYWSPLVIKFQA